MQAGVMANGGLLYKGMRDLSLYLTRICTYSDILFFIVFKFCSKQFLIIFSKGKIYFSLVRREHLYASADIYKAGTICKQKEI